MKLYKRNKQEYPRVTSILDLLNKSAIPQWAANQAIEYIRQEVMTKKFNTREQIESLLQAARFEWRNAGKQALDIGSEIHNLIELYIKDGRDAVGELKPEVENGFLAFLGWEKENVKQWIESEIIVFHSDACYAGTADAIVELKNGKIYLIDFKSSKGFYDGYDMQISGYRGALSNMVLHGFIQDYNVEGIGILRLDKETGLPEFKDYSAVYEQKLEAFLRLVDFYYAVSNRRCKNIRTQKEATNADNR